MTKSLRGGKRNDRGGVAPVSGGIRGLAPVMTKCQQVESILLDKIRRSAKAEGSALPSESALMAELRVSRATVRRAIRNLVRAGVIESRAGVGHIVRSATQKPTIALLFGRRRLLTFQSVPFYQQTLTACQQEAERCGCRPEFYMIRLGSLEHLSDRARLIRDIRTGMVRGVLAVAWPCPPEEDAGLARQDAALAETFEECQIPYTGTNPKTVPGGVGCDYYQVGLLGASYFLDQGRRRIGLMVGDSGDHVHEDAIRGYQAALARAGLSVQPERICCVKDLSEGGGYHGFRAWWPGAGRPEAVVVNDDILCRGAMQAALDLGIAIPERFQFASLAIKGSPLFFSRPFVRLEIDAAARARLLVQRLLEMIRQPGATPDPICLAPRLVPPVPLDPAPVVAGEAGAPG